MAPCPKLTKRGKRRLANLNKDCRILVLPNGYNQLDYRHYIRRCKVHARESFGNVKVHAIDTRIIGRYNNPANSRVKLDAELYQHIEKYDMVTYITNAAISTILTTSGEAPASVLTKKVQRYAQHVGVPFVPAHVTLKWLRGEADINKWL